MKPVIRGPTSQWQFSLRHVFVGVVAANGLFALIAWNGVIGALLFVVAFGIVLLILGTCKGDRRFVFAGAPMLLVAGGMLFMVGGTVLIGDGHTTRPCTIEVCDQSTGDFIAGATVRIRDVFLHGVPEGVPVVPVPIGEPGVSEVTDGNGMAVIPFKFQFSERHGQFIDEARLYIPEYFWLQVEAPGYESELIPLRIFIGGSHDYFVPLPKMKVGLKRAGRPAHN